MATAPPPPPSLWLDEHRLLLMAALIPSSLVAQTPLPPTVCPLFFRRLHLELAAQLAERLRRRMALLAMTDQVDAAAPPSSQLRHPPALPPERQLFPDDLRRLEIQRRAAVEVPVLPPLPSSPAGHGDPPSPAALLASGDGDVPGPRAGVAPACGVPRQRWLRDRLILLLREDTVVCPKAVASSALDLLALFETVTNEVYADTPGVRLASRLIGFGKVMGNLTREVEFAPPLVQFNKSGRASWNRRPCRSLDVALWRAGIQEAERHALPVARLRTQRVLTNDGLVSWVKSHRYLQAAALTEGETTMALLILWEVDHSMPFPSQGPGIERRCWLPLRSG